MWGFPGSSLGGGKNSPQPPSAVVQGPDFSVAPRVSCSFSILALEEWKIGCTGAQVVVAVGGVVIVWFVRMFIVRLFWGLRRPWIRLDGVGFVLGTP